MNASFKISYDGPALADHEMNVKDFAPALLALGELLEEANGILNGKDVKLAVNIRATEQGSIEALLTAVQSVSSTVGQMTSLFSGDQVSAVVNAKELLEIIGIGIGMGGSGGVIGILKWLKGRQVKNVVELEDDKFKLELEGGEVRLVSKKEIRLFTWLNIRKNIEAIIHVPLQKTGIEKVSLISDSGMQSVEKSETDYFIAPIVEREKMGDSIMKINLQIVNISFQEGGKWRFSDGNSMFFADITDKGFMEKIQKNEEVFARDDILFVDLKIKQYLENGLIKTEHEIVKILEHKSAAIQIQLPFGESGKEELK
ncbi:MAG: hypothetical protein PHC70_00870 [Patescibacteria group bacterium]|nr:hypothetical protein [Patescibacteria group bacterium]